jgi:hypothetical protein
MTDRRDRSDRLRKRFEDDAEADEFVDEPGDETTETGGSPAESDSSAESSAGASENGGEDTETVGEAADKRTATDDSGSVKDRPSVLMYLPEDTRQELDIRFDELNARYKREHGEPLEKNRDYYPAVVRAGLEDRSLEEILDL